MLNCLFCFYFCFNIYLCLMIIYFHPRFIFLPRFHISRPKSLEPDDIVEGGNPFWRRLQLRFKALLHFKAWLCFKAMRLWTLLPHWLWSRIDGGFVCDGPAEDEDFHEMWFRTEMFLLNFIVVLFIFQYMLGLSGLLQFQSSAFLCWVTSGSIKATIYIFWFFCFIGWKC